jgi:hypothetical protein
MHWNSRATFAKVLLVGIHEVTIAGFRHSRRSRVRRSNRNLRRRPDEPLSENDILTIEGCGRRSVQQVAKGQGRADSPAKCSVVRPGEDAIERQSFRRRRRFLRRHFRTMIEIDGRFYAERILRSRCIVTRPANGNLQVSQALWHILQSGYQLISGSTSSPDTNVVAPSFCLVIFFFVA